MVATVVCSSTDTHHNTGTASFEVKVRTPAESLAVLIGAVEGNLHQSDNLLANALRSIDVAQNSSSCNMLGGFINQAAAQSGKSLDPGLAGQFTTTAGHIRGALACP